LKKEHSDLEKMTEKKKELKSRLEQTEAEK